MQTKAGFANNKCRTSHYRTVFAKSIRPRETWGSVGGARREGPFALGVKASTKE